MKRFKEFINENIKDLLTGKSEEAVLKELEGLNDDQKIQKIIKYNLPFELLPRDEDGICHILDGLIVEETPVNQLPDNLHVHGSVSANWTEMEKIGENITVDGSFYCCWNRIKEIPKSLKVKADIFLTGNDLTELPRQFTVGGNLDVDENNITEIPDDLIVLGYLSCHSQQHGKLVKIPKKAIIAGKIYLKNEDDIRFN